ncbi:MAG TPA: ABC transporter permease [Bacteroidetes bacterium]|nr:ABC transporter permease [Bacteroidota bacterium]
MGFQTWILLKKGTNIKLLEEKIAGLMDETVNELFKSINARIYGFFEPLSDIYLNSKVERQQVKGDKRAIQLFTISALLILLIACFNFTDLSTTKSLLRAREVGVRKVFRANKKQLIIHHLGESMLLILLAFVLALIIIELSLHRGVEPLVMLTWHNPFNPITFRVNEDNQPAAIIEIGQAWKELANDQPIKYLFMEDKQNELYAKKGDWGIFLEF